MPVNDHYTFAQNVENVKELMNCRDHVHNVFISCIPISRNESSIKRLVLLSIKKAVLIGARYAIMTDCGE